MNSLPASVLLICYIACITGLNLMGCLISAFYQRKFEPSPTTGYIIAIVAGLLAICSMLLPKGDSVPVEIIQVILLWTAGIASAWNSYGLFTTLKKIRK
jgi:hypothetical protein